MVSQKAVRTKMILQKSVRQGKLDNKLDYKFITILKAMISYSSRGEMMLLWYFLLYEALTKTNHWKLIKNNWMMLFGWMSIWFQNLSTNFHLLPNLHGNCLKSSCRFIQKLAWINFYRLTEIKEKIAVKIKIYKQILC